MIHYTHVSRAGGARYVYELVRNLAKLCGETTLVCPEDFQFRADLEGCENIEVQSVLPSLISAEGKKFHLISRLLWSAFVGAWLVLKTRRRERVVHANFPGLIFSVMPTLLLWRMAGIKVVFTVHDVIPHRWLLPQFARRVEVAVFWVAYHAATHLIVHHTEAKLQLQQRFGIRPEKISIIPHGSFSLEAAPLPMPPTEVERVVLLFGTLRENKGIHLAIRAVQQLRNEGHAVVLRICGQSSMSEHLYWESCKQLIASASDGITIVERYVSDTELREVIGSSHFLILPYTEFHSQSGVAALALSNGRPIIATRAGGLADIVIPGETGVVIAAPQVTEVKEALCNALRMSDDELQSMAINCTTMFRTKYSWSRIAALHRALYYHLVPDRSPRQLSSKAHE
jgi:glycosyltransferase involved in cell wall biosynthesis